MQFFQLLLDPVTLEVRQVINKQLAVKVVAFVLNAHRQQAFGDHFERLAVTVQRLDLDTLRAIDAKTDVGLRIARLLRGD